jgi:hypothetical protein
LKLKSKLAGAAIALVAVGGFAFASLDSGASVLPPVQNTTGESGYSVTHYQNYHIRDAHAAFVVTAAMMSLNGDSAYPGAVGADLCDDDDNVAAQFGLTFLSGKFEALAAYGTLSSQDGNDPCTQNGVLVTAPGTSLAAGSAVQLAGSDGITSGSNTLTGAGGNTYVFPGNENQPSVDQTPIVVGDTVSFDTYYNANAKSNKHNIQFTLDVYSTTGSFVKEIQFTAHIRTENFFEAGIGVENTNAPQLTAPADLSLVHFSDATFTNYNGSAINKLNGGWGLTQDDTINGAGQITLQPTSPVGNTFSILEGSASS